MKEKQVSWKTGIKHRNSSVCCCPDHVLTTIRRGSELIYFSHWFFQMGRAEVKPSGTAGIIVLIESNRFVLNKFCWINLHPAGSHHTKSPSHIREFYWQRFETESETIFENVPKVLQSNWAHWWWQLWWPQFHSRQYHQLWIIHQPGVNTRCLKLPWPHISHSCQRLMGDMSGLFKQLPFPVLTLNTPIRKEQTGCVTECVWTK